MAKDNVYYNHSGYYDPTAGKAINQADKVKKRKRKPTRKNKGKAAV